MGTVFTVWCDTDEEGGPELKRSAGGPALLDPDAWSAWLIEHQHHDMSLIAENTNPFGLPEFRVNCGGIRFNVTSEDEVQAGACWGEYRAEYGVHASKETRKRENAAFLAGWAAARRHR